MIALSRRPVIVQSGPAIDPCAHCDVRSRSVCSAIEDRDLSRLAALAQVIDIPRGKVFIEEGESADHFFNITAGTARLYKLLPDGRRQITGFARLGHFLGLAVQKSYTFSAEAIEPVRLCRFSRPKLRALLDDFPAMEKRLLETANNELVAAQEQMLLLGRKTARERIASFLIAQRNCGEYPDTTPIVLHLPISRADIADYLGLTVETVSRTFSRLKTEKLIALGTSVEVIILDLKRLTALSNGMI